MSSLKEGTGKEGTGTFPRGRGGPPHLPSGEGASPRAYWRSLDELAESPELRRFIENEFPSLADRMLEPASRRTFLKYMGASLALAGSTACRWPRQEILPFAGRPAGYVPGSSRIYATALELGGVGLGLLAESRDGRPIKLEGNPEHPSSLGGTSAIAQGTLLDLYDPDRGTSVLRRDADGEREIASAEFARLFEGHFAELRASAGRGLRVLAEASGSPSLDRLRGAWRARFPEAEWYEWEPLSRDAEREGLRLLFGAPCRVQARFDRAQVILALDEDFLLGHPAAVRHARDFVAGREPGGESISRLYVVESGYTVTGTMADQRVPVSAGLVPVVAGCVGAQLVLEHGLPLPAGLEPVARMLERFQAHPLYTEVPGEIARDLLAAGGRSLLVAGERQPPAVHALAQALNHALGNVGRTVSYTAAPDPDRPTHVEGARRLAAEIDAGAVGTLVVIGGNPAYDGPADLELQRRIAAVPHTFRLAPARDETSLVCGWHVPRAHYLEAWGDTRDWRGLVTPIQPLIEPLFGGFTALELVAAMNGDGPMAAHEIVRETIAGLAAGEEGWRRALHDGFVAGSEWPAVEPAFAAADWSDRLAPFLRRHVRADRDPAEIELAFARDPCLYDGRFANNGWLQELPDPLTKLTWDNALLLGPATAAELELDQGALVRLATRDGRTLDLPVHVMPGQPRGSASVHLGYGRRAAGRVGNAVGFDSYALRTIDAMDHVEVRLTKLGRSWPLATTQLHHAIDPLGAAEADERSHLLARELEYDDWLSAEHAAGAGEHGAHTADLWAQWEYEGYKWGMGIDLNRCIGCSACVVACQAENNIPVVGKQEVRNGREMLWLRVDRYFHGEPERPTVVHQPLPCQHCENAPCEQVCPVAATVHDTQGLNVMVYNRCVGTRYCMNNCPYKVRRFNYFNNHRHETALEAMVYNPEVTVRSRGVMEKCTFCVQRIQRATLEAKREGRRVREAELTTACAQACPTRAIAFGDLNDAGTAVHRAFADRRAYALLDWLAVKPRTRYLTRLRNRRSRTAPGAHGA